MVLPKTPEIGTDLVSLVANEARPAFHDPEPVLAYSPNVICSVFAVASDHFYKFKVRVGTSYWLFSTYGPSLGSYMVTHLRFLDYYPRIIPASSSKLCIRRYTRKRSLPPWAAKILFSYTGNCAVIDDIIIRVVS